MDNSFKPKLTLEVVLYLLAFCAALGFRFLNLGQAPAGDGEARLAIQAMQMATGSSPQLDPQAGYLTLTSVLFFLFGRDNWLARFWPALAGAFLALAPYLFRERLGRSAAVVLAFLIAFDPGLVAISRQADGRMLALTLALLAAGFFLARKPAAAGIFAGLVLLSGPSIWLGLLGLGLGYFIFYALQPAVQQKYNGSLVGIYESPETPPPAGRHWGKLGLWALGSFLAFGSLFLTQTPALGAAAGSLAAFIEGLFGRLPGQSLQLVLLAWIVSAPLTILLGVTEAFRAKRSHDSTGLFLSWWWAAALLLALVNPGRHAADLIWPVVPMLAMGARTAARIFDMRGEKTVFFAHACLTAALLGSMWLSVVGAVSAYDESEQAMRLAGMLASFFLLLAASFLIIWGWGLRVTGRGLRLGAAALLVIYSLSTAWQAAGLGNHPETELWRLDAYPKDADLLADSLRDFSMWKTGRPEALDVALSGLESPSLQWALRDMRTVKVVSGLSSSDSPALVVTPLQNELNASAPYSGQVLAWNTLPDWEKMAGKTWLKWLMFREAPLLRQEIQLWARTDLFPGAATLPKNP